VLAASVLAAGCGSSNDDKGSGDSAAASTTTAKPASSSPGFAKVAAEATAAESIPGAPFTVAPLGKPVPKNLHVAYVTCTLPQCGQNDAKEPAAALGWKLDTVPYDIAKGPTDEIRAMRQAIQKGAKYIVYSVAFDPKALAGVVKEAGAKGIKMVAYAAPTAPAPPVYSNMAGPPYYTALARLATIGAIADAGKATVIGYARDPSIPAFKTYGYDGVQQGIKEANNGTKLKVSDFSTAAPQAQTVGGFVNFIRANPDVKYFLTPSSPAFTGLPQGLRQANLANKVKLIVVEPQGPDVRSIKSGDIWMGAAGENHALLYRTMDVFARLALDVPLTEDQKFPTGWGRLITSDNVANVSGSSATSDGAPVPADFASVYKKAWGIG
jgi:ABC-type sugar transport system substrate-binding protein